MSIPFLSIVIANYNYGRFLETAIQSVLWQCEPAQGLPLRLASGEKIELIVVDGGSTDNSVEIIKKYQDRLVWWCSEKDKGQSHAFNKGFAHASGKFLTWLNADDVILPGGLSAVAREVDAHPNGKWFVGSTLWLDESLRIVRCFRAHHFSVIRARWGALSVGGPSSFFERALFERLGTVDENLHFLMDIDLWYRLYFHGNIKYTRTKEYVWGYRIHKESKMSGSDVAPDNPKNRLNRIAADREEQIILKRYGKKKGEGLVVKCCSVSIVDWVICFIENSKKRGRFVFESEIV